MHPLPGKLNEPRIVKIEERDFEAIRVFLQNAGASLSSFRYFSTRSADALRSHLVTALFYLEDVPVGYGHLDREGDKIWLGIAVTENMVGRGIGTYIMRFLIDHARVASIKRISLSVDESNTGAISLYKKFGFVPMSQLKPDVLLMKWEEIA